MAKRSSTLLLQDILESARKIRRYTAGQRFEDFESDEKAVNAVARNFEIIGEAASQFPETFRMTNTNVDWTRIRGFRNRIVHKLWY